MGKTISFNMPPCPIKAGAFLKSFPETLPTKSPIPIKAGAKGTVTAKNAKGQTLFELALQATVGPGDDAAAEDGRVTACGCTCACAGVECAGLPVVPLCGTAAKDGATSCATFARAANQILATTGTTATEVSACSGPSRFCRTLLVPFFSDRAALHCAQATARILIPA